MQSLRNAFRRRAFLQGGMGIARERARGDSDGHGG